MKRFTDTAKWGDPWFRKMPPRMKLLWQYICDNCDAAGVILFDAEAASFSIGEMYSEEDVLFFGERVRKLDSGRVMIVKFIQFQYGELSTDCRPHKVVFEAIRKHKLQYPIEYPINGVSDTPQEKEKDKDKDGKESAERKTKDNLPTSDRSKRIAALFGRKLTTEWSDKEISAFKKIAKQPDEDFELVEQLYRSDYEFLRHDLLAFLNNFTGEVDKARKWKAGKLNGNLRTANPTNPRVTGTANEQMCQQYAGIGRPPGTSETNGGSGQPCV